MYVVDDFAFISFSWNLNQSLLLIVTWKPLLGAYRIFVSTLNHSQWVSHSSMKVAFLQATGEAMYSHFLGLTSSVNFSGINILNMGKTAVAYAKLQLNNFPLSRISSPSFRDVVKVFSSIKVCEACARTIAWSRTDQGLFGDTLCAQEKRMICPIIVIMSSS